MAMPFRTAHVRIRRVLIPALAAGGTRTALPTSDDSRFYAFRREFQGAAVIVALDFQPEAADIVAELGNRQLATQNIATGEQMTAAHQLTAHLPEYGYAMHAVEPVEPAS